MEARLLSGRHFFCKLSPHDTAAMAGTAFAGDLCIPPAVHLCVSRAQCDRNRRGVLFRVSDVADCDSSDRENPGSAGIALWSAMDEL